MAAYTKPWLTRSTYMDRVEKMAGFSPGCGDYFVSWFCPLTKFLLGVEGLEHTIFIQRVLSGRSKESSSLNNTGECMKIS